MLFRYALMGVLSWVCLASGSLFAQVTGHPYLRHYDARTYKASATNYAAVQDSRGILYFGNYGGILTYDGSTWQLLPLSQQQAVRELAVDGQGMVYVGVKGDFGWLIPDALGKLHYQSLRSFVPDSIEIPLSQVRIFGASQGAYFHFPGLNRLFFWDHHTLHEWVPPLGVKLSSLLLHQDRLWAIHPDGMLWAFPLEETGTTNLPIGNAEMLATDRVLQHQTVNDGQSLIRLFSKGFWRINWQQDSAWLEPFETALDARLKKDLFTTLLPLRDGHFLVGTVKQGAFFLDENGEIIYHLHQETGLPDNLILNAFQDRRASVWLSTSRGLVRVEWEAPLQHWGEAHGLSGIVFDVVQHAGRTYAATPLGVYVLENDRFKLLRGINHETFRLLSTTGTNPSLLAATIQGVYRISDRKVRQIPYTEKAQYIVAGNADQQADTGPYLYYVTEERTLVRHSLREKNAQPETIGLAPWPVQSMVLEPAEGLWLVELLGQGRVMKMDAKGVSQIYDLANGLPPTQAVFLWGEEPVFSTRQGLFRLNAERDSFVQDERIDLGAFMGIANLTQTSEGIIWMERYGPSKRWIERAIPQTDKGYRRDSVVLNGWTDTERWGSLHAGEDGHIWLGSPEGLYRYRPDAVSRKMLPLPPLVRKVMLAGDSLLFGGTFLQAPDSSSWRYALRQARTRIPRLLHHQNSLSFFFSAPYYEQENATRYSFRLIGRDRHWSAWQAAQKQDFASLPSGKYTFEVKARNAFHEESEVSSYTFEIAKPWYRTTWAYIGYGLLALMLIYGVFQLNTQRLHLQNEHLERLVHERTTEIWEQHKEIVKKTVKLKRQKTALKSAHDSLEEKNEALEQAMLRLKGAQSKLVDAEKMASLGQLTAGIAHEINNPINYVKGNINPLRKDFEEIRSLFWKIKELENARDLPAAVAKIKAYAEEIDAVYLFEEMEQLLAGISDGALRTKEIVDGLKTFSRSDLDHFKFVDIHAGLDATLTLLNNKLKDRVRIVRDYAEMPFVECLPGKLNQVFMNVLDNAVRAIEDAARQRLAAGAHAEGPNGFIGEIHLQTELIEDCQPHTEGCVQICITDNGVGIPLDIQPRIFEPFFSTKEVGEGTGLGLAISFGIIEQHKGKIEVRSNPREGATFCITLPFRQTAPTEAAS